MRVFVRTAEPIWAMVGKWLRDGMNVQSGEHGEKSSDLDEEFFIESSGVGIGMMSMGLLDPDFWTEGYCLRDQLVPGGVVGEDWESARQRLVPSFLDHIADPILGTGKAIGLARVLGLSQPSQGLSRWLSFADVIYSSLNSELGDGIGPQKDRLSALFSVSVDSLSRIVYDWLWPVCEATGDWVVNIIVDDCELWRHLNAIEDLFLMRKGDALSHLIDLIFLKMDSNQPWGDFHSLNKAFGDVVRSTLKVGVQEWIQVSLVRLSYRGHRDSDKQINRTLKAIEGLQIEYAVPFPLTYIFRPDVVQKYSEIFVFLLQIRRAKHVLERILVRGDRERDNRFKEELKLFYAMRSRLSWFVNTLLTFLTTYVLHIQVRAFHEELGKARSLDEIIQVHDQHVSKLQARCLLDDDLATLHRTILSILDMCLHFSSVFTAFAGSATATHDVSSLSMTLKHRSRRQKRQQRNVIGFSQPFTPSVVSSDEDSDEEDVLHEGDSGPPEPSFSMDDSILEAGADFFGTLEQMSKELDGLAMSEGLKRAREPYRIKNALVGLGLGAFAVGVWAYSISAVKQDEFDDVDEEAKALGAGAANASGKQGEKVPVAPALPVPNPSAAAAVAEATANIVLPGTLPLPSVTTPPPPTSPSPAPRGILQLLDKRWPRVLDPESKTVVSGAPSVDNVGRMGGSRS
ncbi:hypothetical protein EST38_g21 [Candolleomyces aberdarensis]|uniref:Spindle pole body component n=1 Tax=Candolleomyces aberdarensis TaxID=2316362 RepID=A0A4Q2E1F1_9AGAR|nr:hypothetical protein EST38_g21 [Candolleomyces aberdarensis]